MKQWMHEHSSITVFSITVGGVLLIVACGLVSSHAAYGSDLFNLTGIVALGVWVVLGAMWAQLLWGGSEKPKASDTSSDDRDEGTR